MAKEENGWLKMFSDTMNQVTKGKEKLDEGTKALDEAKKLKEKIQPTKKESEEPSKDTAKTDAGNSNGTTSQAQPKESPTPYPTSSDVYVPMKPPVIAKTAFSIPDFGARPSIIPDEKFIEYSKVMAKRDKEVANSAEVPSSHQLIPTRKQLTEKTIDMNCDPKTSNFSYDFGYAKGDNNVYKKNSHIAEVNKDTGEIRLVRYDIKNKEHTKLIGDEEQVLRGPAISGAAFHKGRAAYCEEVGKPLPTPQSAAPEKERGK